MTAKLGLGVDPVPVYSRQRCPVILPNQAKHLKSQVQDVDETVKPNLGTLVLDSA